MPEFRPLRAIICARVSTDQQAQTGVSLSHQLDVGREKAAEIGASIVGYCIEEGASGALYESRRELQNALGQIERGQADALIFFDLSRLSRDVENLLAIERRVTRAGGQIIYCNAHYAKSATGRLHQTIDAAIKDHERARLREVSMENRRKRVQSGVQTQRSVSPLGFRVVNRDDVIRGDFDKTMLGKYVVKDEEAATVRFIFERYAGGDSLRQIARSLHEQGVPTPKGGRSYARKTPDGTPIQTNGAGQVWLASSLKTILHNPAYYGRASFGKTRNVYDESLLQRGYTKAFKRERVPQSEWIYLDCPAIVDKSLWDVCQVRMTEAQTLFAGSPARKYMLTGLLRCPKCHRTMCARRTHAPFTTAKERVESSKRIAYSCKWFSPGRSIAGQCYSKSFWGDVLEARVVSVVLEAVSRPDLLGLAFDAHRQKQTALHSPDTIADLERELSLTNRHLQTALDAQLDARFKGIDSSIYESRLRDLGRTCETLRERIETARRQSQKRKSLNDAGSERATFITRAIGDIAVALESPHVPPVAKQAMLARVIESIYTVSDEGDLKIVFRIGALSLDERWIWEAGAWRVEEADTLNS